MSIDRPQRGLAAAELVTFREFLGKETPESYDRERKALDMLASQLKNLPKQSPEHSRSP
jgi:hypothetical protein